MIQGSSVLDQLEFKDELIGDTKKKRVEIIHV